MDSESGKILRMNYKLKKISGDASFREFYRLKKNNKTSIIVSAKKEKFKNLAVYAVINNVLNKNKINAPKLLSTLFITAYTARFLNFSFLAETMIEVLLFFFNL